MRFLSIFVRSVDLTGSRVLSLAAPLSAPAQPQVPAESGGDLATALAGSPVAGSVALVLLAVALFQLWVFAVDRGNSLALWLGLTSGAVAIGALLEGGGAPGLVERLSAGFLHLSVAVAIPLFWRLLERPSGSPWQRGFRWLQAALAVLVPLMPASWLEASEPWRWLSLAPFPALILGLFWQRLKEGSGGRELAALGLGAGAVVVAESADIVLHVLRLGASRPVPTLAWGLFVLVILGVLDRRRQKTELQLRQLHQQMDHMVEDRTNELSESNQRLQDEIAERQLAEGAMRMLESAVEQSVDGIAVADLSGGMQFINEAWARMHGYEVFELLGYDLEIFHTPEQMQDQVRPLMDQVQAEGAHQAEIEHRRRGGAIFPTWQTSTRLTDEEGEATGFVFIARDITERLEAEAERR
ncbi:MAG: PAS domain S-box protein, partial [Acidobacteriota bacterium]